MILILVGTAASAQFMNKLSIRDTSLLKRSMINYPYNKEWYKEGKLFDSVKFGKVYQMPADRMLCIVPDARKNAPMPVKRIGAPERMPNAFPRKDHHYNDK
jgi:hypothetical protein